MEVIEGIKRIEEKFSKSGQSDKIPLLRGQRTFHAELTEGGILVNNLGTQPFLPWKVFQESLDLLIRSDGVVDRGDAMNHKLGEPELSFDSLEGHIAKVVYGKMEGDSVFRRVTPIVCILVWAGICETAPGQVILR